LIVVSTFLPSFLEYLHYIDVIKIILAIVNQFLFFFTDTTVPIFTEGRMTDLCNKLKQVEFERFMTLFRDTAFKW